MKKPYKLIILISVLYILCAVAPTAFIFALPNPYSDTYLAELPVKIDRLKSAEGRRIILVGGSAVPFGIDSSMMEAEFSADSKVPEHPGRLQDYEIVDFGLYGTIGSKVSLEILRRYLRKDDIVIVLPEQQEDSLDGFFDGKYLWQALGIKAAGYAFDLDADERTMLFNRLPAYLWEKVQLLFAGTDTADYGIYAKESFNEYGDIGVVRDENIMPGDYDPDNMIRFDKGFFNKGLFSYLSEYKSICDNKGAALYLGYAPMNGMAVIRSQEEISEYEYGLRDSLSVPVLGTALEAVMDPEYFYDTNYHLNSAGVGEYTRRLIKWIRAEYGDRSYTHPSDTKAPDTDGEGEDNESTVSDTDTASSSEGFIYEEGRNGIRITGLSGELIESEEIVIPETIDGKAVSAVSDGIFADCHHLKRIVMRSATPASVRVGRHLLEGTSADVIVPKGSLSAYRTNYFWSGYADRIRENS